MRRRILAALASGFPVRWLKRRHRRLPRRARETIQVDRRLIEAAMERQSE